LGKKDFLAQSLKKEFCFADRHEAYRRASEHLEVVFLRMRGVPVALMRVLKDCFSATLVVHSSPQRTTKL
jgi:hypothetical protein